MSLVLAVMTVLTPAGCGSSPAEHPPTPGTLARDYFNSLTADERANLAAHGTPEDFLGSLLGAYRCQDAPGDHRGCPPDAAVTATAHRLGGTLYERTILVKHHDGHFESLPLYVTAHANGPAELIDDTGRAYCQWPFGSPRRRPRDRPAGGHEDLPNGGQILPRRWCGSVS